MTDSVDSQSGIKTVYKSGLSIQDYLLSLRQQYQLSDSELKYLLGESNQESLLEDDIENSVNYSINNAIKECEKDLSKEDFLKNILYKLNENKDFTKTLLKTQLTLNNFEEVFCLREFKAVELPYSSDESYRNIRYKDQDGTTLAIVQINTENSKIRVQTFGELLPKQEFVKPQQVNYRVMSKAKAERWTSEYGGINQFDGSIEIRYKNADGDVMAAVIFKQDGNVDTVVEYEYKNGKKVQMLHTSQFGHSKTIYDEVTDVTKLIVDVDTDSNICCITADYI